MKAEERNNGNLDLMSYCFVAIFSCPFLKACNETEKPDNGILIL